MQQRTPAPQYMPGLLKMQNALLVQILSEMVNEFVNWGDVESFEAIMFVDACLAKYM